MIDALLTHLASACPDFAAIEDATRINPMERDEYPVVTLYLASESPDEQTLCGAGTVLRSYDLLLTCRTGDELESARAALKAALRTFTATGLVRGPSFTGGQVAALSGALMQWRDSWQLAVADD